MNFFTPKTILSYVFGLCILNGAEPETLELGIFEELLLQRDQHTSVISDVVQKKEIPSLAEPLITKGKLWMVPQKSFRWEQGDPVTDIALFDEEKVYLINEREESVESYKPSSRSVRSIMLLLGMGEDATFEGLLDDFEPIECTNTEDECIIKMLPDSGLMKRVLTELTISIDRVTAFPHKIVWKQKDGAVIMTSFVNTLFDQELPEAVFETPQEEPED